MKSEVLFKASQDSSRQYFHFIQSQNNVVKKAIVIVIVISKFKEYSFFPLRRAR